MITGEYEKLQEIAKYNVCSEHKANLEVAWVDKHWVLRCGADGGHYPASVTRNPSLVQMFKEGEELPGPIADNVRKRLTKEAKMVNENKEGTSLALLPKVDLGSGVQLTEKVITQLVNYAKKYDLDPELGHVVFMYGKPYVTLDGYLYHARRSGAAYSLESRPMSGDEHDAYNLGSTDYGWLATVTLIITQEVYTGLGIVTYKEIKEPSKNDPQLPAHPVVANNPQLLCQKRAEWQALRRAFPLEGE